MALALGRRGTLWDALRDRAGERPDWAAAWEFLRRAAGPRRPCHPARAAGRGARPARRPRPAAGAARRRRPPSRSTSCSAPRWTTPRCTRRRCRASCTGSAAPARRSSARPAAPGGAVRVMTVHGAKGLQAPLVHPAGHDRRCRPRTRSSIWSDDPATGGAGPALGAAQGVLLPGGPATPARRARGRADAGVQPPALRGADPRGGPAGRLRLGPASAAARTDSWYTHGRARVRRARGRRRRRSPPAGTARCWPRADRRRRAPAARRRSGRGDAPRRCRAWAGRPGDWRPAPPPPEPALPVPLAPSRPGRRQFGPVPRARSPLDAADRAEPLPARHPGARAAAAPAGARPGALGPGGARPPCPPRPRPEPRSSRLAAQALARAAPSRARPAVRPRRPRRAAHHRPGRRHRGNRQGRPHGRAARRGAARRLQDRPRRPRRRRRTRRCSTCASSPPIAPCCRRIYPDRPVRCALVWTEGPPSSRFPRPAGRAWRRGA